VARWASQLTRSSEQHTQWVNPSRERSFSLCGRSALRDPCTYAGFAGLLIWLDAACAWTGWQSGLAETSGTHWRELPEMRIGIPYKMADRLPEENR
jgi:hypothetical protein